MFIALLSEALKGFNASGLDIMGDGYDCIANLQSLEVLMLRNSNIMKTEWFRHMSILRSLDLGGTKVHLSDSFGSNVRLEELLLDDCKFPNLEGTEQEYLNCFKSLRALRCLNICESETCALDGADP